MGIYGGYVCFVAGLNDQIQIQGVLARPTGKMVVLGLHPSSRPRTLVYFDHSAREMGHKLQHVITVFPTEMLQQLRYTSFSDIDIRHSLANK